MEDRSDHHCERECDSSQDDEQCGAKSLFHDAVYLDAFKRVDLTTAKT